MLSISSSMLVILGISLKKSRAAGTRRWLCAEARVLLSTLRRAETSVITSQTCHLLDCIAVITAVTKDFLNSSLSIAILEFNR